MDTPRPPILYSQSFSTVIIRTFILLNTLSSSFSWPSLESVVLYPNPFVFSQNQHCADCVLKPVHSGRFPSCSHQHTALPAVVIGSLFLLFPKGEKNLFFFFQFSFIKTEQTEKRLLSAMAYREQF